MNQYELSLPRPPIVEAVLDIECDMPPEQTLTSLEGAARERFRDQYPTFRSQVLRQHQIESKPSEPLAMSVREDVQALQFVHADGNQLVQLRAQGFSFNRLAPYVSLDHLLPEIERTWKLFVELTLPVQIRLIRLRYINRISLPMENGSLDLDRYLRTGPRLPDEESLRLLGFFHQHSSVEVKTGHRVDSVMTGQPAENGKLPIILDNSVSSEESHEPSDWTWVLDKVRSLRVLKNRIFKNALTETCIDLLQQS